ncbi:hypothetical protein D908_16154 [Vibrio mimicus CAIM 602]|nr:hypothetical protein D908_16154 [Vibrio mimicus CAIM 602]
MSFTFFPCEHANNLGGITTHLAIKHHSFEVSDFEKKPPEGQLFHACGA